MDIMMIFGFMLYLLLFAIVFDLIRQVKPTKQELETPDKRGCAIGCFWLTIIGGIGFLVWITYALFFE